MTTDVGSLTLRPMQWTDLEVVHALEQRLFAVDPWTPELFWSELAGVPSTRTYLVAECDGALVGYAGLMVSGRDADVQTVAVDDAVRRTGIGRHLVQALLHDARARGCTVVMLEVAAGNEPARHLYDSLGFAEVGRRRDYYAPGADALVLRRRLGRGEPA